MDYSLLLFKKMITKAQTQVIYFLGLAIRQVSGWYLAWQPIASVCEWVNERHKLTAL